MKLERDDVVLAIALVAYVVSQLNILRVLGPIRDELLTVQLNVSAPWLTETVSGWAAEQHDAFLEFLAWDTIHPFLYGFVLWWAVRRVNTLTPLEPLVMRTMSLAALAAPLLDLIENGIMFYLIDDLSHIAQPAVLLGGLAAWGKWLLAAVVVGFLIWRLPRAYRLRPRE